MSYSLSVNATGNYIFIRRLTDGLLQHRLRSVNIQIQVPPSNVNGSRQIIEGKKETTTLWEQILFQCDMAISLREILLANYCPCNFPYRIRKDLAYIHGKGEVQILPFHSTLTNQKVLK